MPKPSIKVVVALFESYLSIRQSHWNLKELDNGTVELPEPTSWEGRKLAVCKELLQHIFAIQNTNPSKVDMHKWTDLILELHHHEVEQLKLYNSQTLGWQHVLLDVIRAMRNYIIGCYAHDKKFAEYIGQLKALQKEHEIDVDRLEKHKEGHNANELTQSKIELDKTNKVLDSLTAECDYLTDFFVDQIMVNDPLYAKLKEADIEEFKKNADANLREGVLCKKVMDSMSKVMRVTTSTPTVKKEEAATSAAPAATANSNLTDLSPSKPGYDVISEVSKQAAEEQAPKQSRSKKSGRSALQANSKFGATETSTIKDTHAPTYNTRSKSGSARNKF